MSDDITKAFVKQFEQGITHLAQQKGTRLRSAVRVKSGIVGDRAFFDQLDSTAMIEQTARHGDTVYTDTPHARRMVTLATFRVADLIDVPDKVKTLNDPTSEYVVSFANAAGRQTDDVIIAAAFATAKTGVDGGTDETFNTTDYRIASGSVGLTNSKLITARKILKEAENDADMGFKICVNQEQLEDMLLDTTTTSGDYAVVKALVSGEIDHWIGFDFIQSERLATTSSERRVIAWAKDQILVCIGAEPQGRITELPTKNFSTQVFYSLMLGATRMSGTGVVEIRCTE